MPETVCIDTCIGRLLEDAKAGALLQKGREEDRRLFWEKHFAECSVCRSAILEHINQTLTFPLLKAIAARKGISFEEVLDRFQQQVEDVARDAVERGLSFQEAFKEKFDK